MDDVVFSSFGDETASIVNGVGAGNHGWIDLGGANRLWQVDNGPAVVDLAIDVPIVNGGLFKTGIGTLELRNAAAYDGDIVVQQGNVIIGGAFITDTSDMFLSAGTGIELDFTGSPDVVNAVYVEGVSLPVGTWGALDPERILPPFCSGARG